MAPGHPLEDVVKELILAIVVVTGLSSNAYQIDGLVTQGDTSRPSNDVFQAAAELAAEEGVQLTAEDLASLSEAEALISKATQAADASAQSVQYTNLICIQSGFALLHVGQYKGATCKTLFGSERYSIAIRDEASFTAGFEALALAGIVRIKNVVSNYPKSIIGTYSNGKTFSLSVVGGGSVIVFDSTAEGGEGSVRIAGLGVGVFSATIGVGTTLEIARLGQK